MVYTLALVDCKRCTLICRGPSRGRIPQAAAGAAGAAAQEQLRQASAALEGQRAATKALAAHCCAAHGQCESLRRGLAVLSGRVDAGAEQQRGQIGSCASR